MKRALTVLIFLALALPAMAATFQIPHLAVGGGFSTSITLTNLISDETQYVYIHFYQANGSNWPVPSDHGTSFRLNFNLDPHASATVIIANQDAAIQNGWAMVVSRGPVLVSTTFEYDVNGVRTATAGVMPDKSALLSLLPAVIDTADGVNTGLALVNPADSAGDATLQLLDGQGQLLGTKTLTIEAKHKYISFLDAAELFPGVLVADGYLKVESLIPLVAMALRTNGPLFSALPAVHDQFPWRNSRTVFASSSTGSDLTGDGTLAKPFKTIHKAMFVADRGWTVYLLPGIYSEASGEEFPILPKYCLLIQGADADSVLIQGGGHLDPYPGNAALIGSDKTVVAEVTISNPGGVGIFLNRTVTIAGCHVVNCATTGIEVAEGFPILFDNVVTGNQIGIHIAAPAGPDMGGGLNYCKGGNFVVGNDQCDLFYEGKEILGIRFNSWDSPDPTIGKTCTGGMDIVIPLAGGANY